MARLVFKDLADTLLAFLDVISAEWHHHIFREFTEEV